MHRLLRTAAAALALTLASCATSGGGAVEESYVQTKDGVLLHYKKVGNGEQVLVIPNEAMTSPDMDRLAKGRTVIYYDLRGRGRSGKANTARLEQDLQDLHELVEWFGLERFSMLGFDYQAALVALYAEQHPGLVERLVLVSPLPSRKFPYWKIYDKIYQERIDSRAFEKLRELQRSGARRLKPEEWSSAYRETVLSGMFLDPRSLDRMRANPLVAPNLDPEPVHRQYKRLLDSLGDWDWRPDLQQVTCPALVVSGSADAVPAESTVEWATSLPAGSSNVFERSGRLPWVERPGDFFPVVERFLDGSN